MLDSLEALLRSIRLGEGAHLELKEVVFAGKRVKGPAREQLADELAAFANGHGGVLVLGVDDRTRDIVGIPLDRLDAAEQYVTEIVHDSIKPPIYPLIERLELPDSGGRAGDRYCVSRSRRACSCTRAPAGFCIASAARSAGWSRTSSYVSISSAASHRLIRFDEQPLHDASFADLDGVLIDRFAIDGMRDDRETLACKLGMAARSGARGPLPTVTGILLGTTEPVERLPHAYVQAVAYRGRSVPESLESPWYQLDAGDIAGPVDRQIAGACLFVARNQKVRARKTMGRIDLPQYDMAAVFEAVVNAVAHRDYAMHGTRIRLHLYAGSHRVVLAGRASEPHDGG